MIMNDKPTVKLDLSPSSAERALNTIAESVTLTPELTECVGTVQLVLKIYEHRLLQMQELQRELFKLKSKAVLFEMSKDSDLISHCAELQSELDAANKRIEELEDLETIELRETGTE